MSIIFQTVFNLLRKREKSGKDGEEPLDEDLTYASDERAVFRDGKDASGGDESGEKDGDGPSGPSE